MAEIPVFRTRYPLRAVLAVAGASLLTLGELALLATCLMPLVPLVPVFIMVMIGNACVLSAALSYASSLARREPLSSTRAETRAETSQALAAPGTEASHAA